MRPQRRGKGWHTDAQCGTVRGTRLVDAPIRSLDGV